MNKLIDRYSSENGRDNNEIRLSEIISIIWKGKWIVIISFAFFAFVSIIYAINQPNIYKSEALLSPAKSDDQSGAGLASLAGQFGGLASLAGINLNSGGDNKTELAIQVMKSRHFINDFINAHHILPELMAAKTWNMDTNTISYDSDIYNEKLKKWTRDVKLPYTAKPSEQEAYKAFMKILFINRSKDTGMVTVGIENISPFLAKQWVTWLVADINREMKKRDVTEATKGQRFLEDQLLKTNVADMRTVLYQLMEQAAKTIMFANVRDEYVFKTIDPAFVPEEKAKPNRALICILGSTLGLIFGVTIILFGFFIKNK